ncbi:MAG: hypothetical protein E7021_04350 [Alphaproteobacteria bacterium]|nr:hypothetical protein [Alphaproteobacteria bacterium]
MKKGLLYSSIVLFGGILLYTIKQIFCPFYVDGECYLCSDERPIFMNPRSKCSEICSDRYMTNDGFEEMVEFGYYCRLKSVKNGPLIIQFSDSYMKENYLNFKLDGEWGHYDYLDRPIEIGEYKNGKKIGIWKRYDYERGVFPLESEIEFENGKKKRIFYYDYESGKRSLVVDFDNSGNQHLSKYIEKESDN